MPIVRVYQLPQKGIRDLELKFPDSWDIEVCNMAGHDRPALTRDEIRAALLKPLGKPTVRELAQGKKEVAIVFDDNSRGQKWHVIAQALLEELAAAVKAAKDNYSSKHAEQKDLVIANVYYKNNEPIIALTTTPSSLKHEGGGVVLVMNCPYGDALFHRPLG